MGSVVNWYMELHNYGLELGVCGRIDNRRYAVVYELPDSYVSAAEAVSANPKLTEKAQQLVEQRLSEGKGIPVDHWVSGNEERLACPA